MNYEEALNKVEKFMIETGIRNFCTNLCFGYCCEKCYTSKNACHKNEGRRLSCSFYLCPLLETLAFIPTETEIYRDVDEKVRQELRRLMKMEVSRSIYFDVHDEAIKKQFFIEESVLNELDKINKEAVFSRIHNIRNMHTRLSRFLVYKIEKLEKSSNTTATVRKRGGRA